MRPPTGYVELEEVHDALAAGTLDIATIWEAVGRGDTRAAEGVLIDAGWEYDEGDLLDVQIVGTPDDRLGEFYQVFVKPKK